MLGLILHTLLVQFQHFCIILNLWLCRDCSFFSTLFFFPACLIDFEIWADTKQRKNFAWPYIWNRPDHADGYRTLATELNWTWHKATQIFVCTFSLILFTLWNVGKIAIKGRDFMKGSFYVCFDDPYYPYFSKIVRRKIFHK